MAADVQAVLAGERQWTIATGDALTLLRGMPDACLHVCATSPPYFALRSYLENGHEHKSLEIGSEPTPEEFVESLVDVFREVRRVLVPFGVCWLNIGDSFNAYNGNRGASPSLSGNVEDAMPSLPPDSGLTAGCYKPLDLLGIPFRLVEALRRDGWYHRDTVVWVKKAPMPSSVAGWRWERCSQRAAASRRALAGSSHAEARSSPMGARDGKDFDSRSQWLDCPGCPKCEANDGYVLRKGAWRHTSAWEPVFMLTPSPVYFCDQDAVRTPPAESTLSRDRYSRVTATAAEEQYAARHDHETICDPGGANPRNVLHLGPSPASFGLCRACGEYHRNVNALKKRGGRPRCPCGAQDFVAHYAAYPPALVEPLLRASTSVEGCCPTCLMPMVRVVEREQGESVEARGYQAGVNSHSPFITHGQNSPHAVVFQNSMQLAPRGGVRGETLGWRPSCSCAAGPPIPMTVLDPFAGTGTTILVARRLGLRAVGLDLSPDYSALARARVLDECPLFGG